MFAGAAKPRNRARASPDHFSSSPSFTRRVLPFTQRKTSPWPASQHQSPKSDIEIFPGRQEEKEKRPDHRGSPKERLGIEAERPSRPYGHYKAKVLDGLREVAAVEAKTASSSW